MRARAISCHSMYCVFAKFEHRTRMEDNVTVGWMIEHYICWHGKWTSWCCYCMCIYNDNGNDNNKSSEKEANEFYRKWQKMLSLSLLNTHTNFKNDFWANANRVRDYLSEYVQNSSECICVSMREREKQKMLYEFVQCVKWQPMSSFWRVEGVYQTKKLHLYVLRRDIYTRVQHVKY